jgi:shikimate 5-dehydrogenase
MVELYDQTIAEDAKDGEIPLNATHSGMEGQQSEQEKKEKALSDQNIRLLATNLLEKISSGTLDIVEGTDQLF